MDNKLAEYLNIEIKGIIKSVRVVQGTAKDSGNVYYAIELQFINGYSKRLFLRSDEQFAWVNAIEMLKTNAIIDNEF